MQRRRFMLALAAGGTLMTISACDRMPVSALEPWQGPSKQVSDSRLRALSWALLAPSPHNMQPWIADVRIPGEVSLLPDAQRMLPATDPFGRQILIGFGAFMELLRMAAAQAGDAVAIEPFPDGVPGDGPLDSRRRVARIRWIGEPARQDPLFGQVQQRRTNRGPYTTTVPTADALARVSAAVQTAGIRTSFAISQEQIGLLTSIATEACRAEFATPAVARENANLIRIGAEEIEREPSGLVIHGPMIWWARRLGLLDRDMLAETDAPSMRRVVEQAVASMTATRVWAWQTSADNSRLSQLAAGRAYLRLCLAATAEGLSEQPCSQALQEYAEMAPYFRRIHEITATPAPQRLQMLARLGYGVAPGPAPRRPLDRVVRI
ncbi:MAG: hypothetical protein RI936_610 [Pseudomonadota bacterium]